MLEYWYQALESKFGIVVKTDNVSGTLQRLYKARKEANDPALSELHLRRSPVDPEAIWIVKNKHDEEKVDGTT